MVFLWTLASKRNKGPWISQIITALFIIPIQIPPVDDRWANGTESERNRISPQRAVHQGQAYNPKDKTEGSGCGMLCNHKVLFEVGLAGFGLFCTLSCNCYLFYRCRVRRQMLQMQRSRRRLRYQATLLWPCSIGTQRRCVAEWKSVGIEFDIYEVTLPLIVLSHIINTVWIQISNADTVWYNRGSQLAYSRQGSLC